jgi:Tfp pilus assembly protein PilF
MKNLKHVALISGLVSSLVFLGNVKQPVALAGWLDSLKDSLQRGSRKFSIQEIELEPQKYCIEYYQKREFNLASLACSLAAKRDPSFYYYTAMIDYWRGSINLELLFGEFKKARQALETKQDVESKQKLAKIYFVMGTLYEKYGPEARLVSGKDYRNVAMNYYEKAATLAEETNEKNAKALALTRLGGYYVEKSDLEKAEMYLQKAVKAWEEVKETAEFPKVWIEYERIEFYYNLGKLAYKKKNYTEAEENFKKALDIARKHFPEKLPEYWNSFGVWLYRMGKYDEAEEYIKKAINRVELEFKKQEQEGRRISTDKLENLAIWYENLAEVYIKKNDLEQAKKSLEQVIKICEKIDRILYEQERKMGPSTWDVAAERLEIKRKKEANERKIKELTEKINKAVEEKNKQKERGQLN